MASALPVYLCLSRRSQTQEEEHGKKREKGKKEDEMSEWKKQREEKKIRGATRRLCRLLVFGSSGLFRAAHRARLVFHVVVGQTFPIRVVTCFGPCSTGRANSLGLFERRG